MASQQYQCRVCGVDYASRGREWRKKKKCVWFPKQPPKHLPKRLWQAPAGQLLCGQCRSPTTCQVTGNASGPEKTIAKQKLKLRKGSKKLAREKRKVKEAKQKIKKLEDVSARKPKATGDFAAFCEEKKVRTPTPPAPPCAHCCSVVLCRASPSLRRRRCCLLLARVRACRCSLVPSRAGPPAAARPPPHPSATRVW